MRSTASDLGAPLFHLARRRGVLPGKRTPLTYPQLWRQDTAKRSGLARSLSSFEIFRSWSSRRSDKLGALGDGVPAPLDPFRAMRSRFFTLPRHRGRAFPEIRYVWGIPHVIFITIWMVILEIRYFWRAGISGGYFCVALVVRDRYKASPYVVSWGCAHADVLAELHSGSYGIREV